MSVAGVVGSKAGFGRLLSTDREATAISALVPERERRQALDFGASRTTALRPELGEYRIVHFATHAMLNNTHPELLCMALSQASEAGRPQDGFFREIYSFKLQAEPAALSACQTGLGKEIKGEGLIGLTHGFMYAGAPRIVASLRKADDRATEVKSANAGKDSPVTSASSDTNVSVVKTDEGRDTQKNVSLVKTDEGRDTPKSEILFWASLFSTITNTISTVSAILLAWISNYRARAELMLKKAEFALKEAEALQKAKEAEFKLAQLELELLKARGPQLIVTAM